jgi:biofilm PGA synthesis N-glycosyltransferase PgaC
MQALLLLSLFFFAYPFAIYPLVLFALIRPRSSEGEASEPDADLPSVALIICALNEERVIGAKLRNSLELDYPEDRLRIILVSDGSSDSTATIAREFLPQVQLIERQERRGKVANLNDVIAGRTEEVIALSDANVIYDSQALRRLIRRLNDPAVGAVSGRVVLVDTTEQIEVAEKNYYSLEWGLQERESVVYSMIGADGAMYAFRRNLFRPCPDDTLIEDLVIPMSIVRQGFRVVFEPQAIGWEEGVSGLREEFRRKVRIAAGAAQALLRGNGWPRGAPWSYWLLFVSHKLLRWLSPLTALAALVLTAVSPEAAVSRAVLAAGLLVLAAAALRAVTGWRNAILDTAFYSVFGLVAQGWGLLRGITGTQSVLWAKADR